MKLINKIFNKIIFEAAIKKAANNNEGEIIYHLLAKEKEISNQLFKGNKKLSKIAIKPIIGYLIRRHFYPTNYLDDASFFTFLNITVLKNCFKL